MNIFGFFFTRCKKSNYDEKAYQKEVLMVKYFFLGTVRWPQKTLELVIIKFYTPYIKTKYRKASSCLRYEMISNSGRVLLFNKFNQNLPNSAKIFFSRNRETGCAEGYIAPGSRKFSPFNSN
jgi:hypothetical protein